jgi:starch synthase
VDGEVWNPATDPLLPRPFSQDDLPARAFAKLALQRELGLRETPDTPLFTVVSRFAPQKGLDLILENLPWFQAQNVQLAVLGQGDPDLEARFMAAACLHPERVAVRIGFDEGLSHRFFGGADALLVPSRREPCGLTQLYALRYGTLPVVRATGGLADTVVDATPSAVREGRATGFVFGEASPGALKEALDRTLDLYRNRHDTWVDLQRRAMAQDFGWTRPARQYLELYEELLASVD